MDTVSLGFALADLAKLTHIGRIVNKKANGGFDQWIVAQSNKARHDYRCLRDGNLDITAALSRYRKMLAFVIVHRGQMAFGAEAQCLAASIIRAIEDVESDKPFNPTCPYCGMVDFVLDDPLHYCDDLYHSTMGI